MNFYEMLIRRSRISPEPSDSSSSGGITPVSMLPRSDMMGKDNTTYFIERGGLWFTTSGNEGTGVKIGDYDDWTYIEPMWYSSQASNTCHGYAIRNGGMLYSTDAGGAVTDMNMQCNLVSGFYFSGPNSGGNTETRYGLAQTDDGLYRLSGSATKISTTHDFIALSGFLYYFSSSVYSSALGLKADGTVHSIAYNGTTTQIATGATAITGTGGNYCYTTSAGDVLSGYSTTNEYPLLIRDGKLYYVTNNGNTAYLIDDTGVWTSIYGNGASTVKAWGVRDGHICSIKSTGYTDLGYDAVQASKTARHVKADGLVYNNLDKRITTATY